MLFLTKRIYNSLKSSKIDFGILKSKSHFIIHNYILDLTRVSKGQIDKLLIGFFFGFSLLGNYFLALQIISVLSILPGIIIKYTLPEDASGSSTKNLKFITAGFSVVLALLGIFVAPLILPIFFPTYSDAVEFLPLLSISLVPSTVSSLYISKFLGMEKSNYVVVGNMIALITAIIGILILGPIWGVIGLAVTIIISSSSQAIFYACFDFYKFKNNSYIS
jgi:O-antigen/teichoic acid export membrane protein